MKTHILLALLAATLMHAPAGAQTFYFAGAGPIADDVGGNPGCGTPRVLTATSNVANPIQDVVLTIGMNHTYVGDLRIRLSYTPAGSPTTITASVINLVGGNTTVNGSFTFVSGATSFHTAVSSFEALTFGAYAPVDRVGAAISIVEFADFFRGLPAAGTWKITVEDCNLFDSGAITSASIVVQARSLPCLADFNTDGVVNSADLVFFLGRFGGTCP